jgi:hypothetical protein
VARAGAEIFDPARDGAPMQSGLGARSVASRQSFWMNWRERDFFVQPAFRQC